MKRITLVPFVQSLFMTVLPMTGTLFEAPQAPEPKDTPRQKKKRYKATIVSCNLSQAVTHTTLP